MAILTVGTPGGGVETFLDVNLEGTVGAFKAVVGMRVRMQQFRLHAKLPTGTIPLKIADDSARLSEVGLKDGGELRLDKLFRFNGPQQAQRRLDKGLTNVAHSLKNGFKEVGGKVDGVEVKVDGVKLGVDTLVAAAQGVLVPRPPGQTDDEELDQLRDTVRTCHKRIAPLRDARAIRVAAAKRGRSAEVTLAADKAQGRVDHVTGEIMGRDLEEKWSNHEAQGKVIKASMRKEKAKGKAQEKAIAKAKAKAKAKAVADVAEADELEQEVENAIFAPVAGVVPEAGASSSDKAAA
jgi:hypothetical protein